MSNTERSTRTQVYASEPVRVFDSAEWAANKQASRDADARALASGVKTREQLWRENTKLPARLTSVDLLAIPIPE